MMISGREGYSGLYERFPAVRTVLEPMLRWRIKRIALCMARFVQTESVSAEGKIAAPRVGGNAFRRILEGWAPGDLGLIR